VTAPGYKPLITQIFDRQCEYLDNDSVFAVKDSLVVDFQPLEGNHKAEFHVPYDIKLASYEDAKKHSAIGSTESSTA
jgi:catechol 1,2-dioxygenase